MKIRKGDQVLIVKGKDKGKQGRVLRGFPKENQVLIDGINIRKVHKRPKREGEKGQIVEIATPIYISKVRLICPKCSKPTRVGYNVAKSIRQLADNPPVGGQKSKIRICKRCGGKI